MCVCVHVRPSKVADVTGRRGVGCGGPQHKVEADRKVSTTHTVVLIITEESLFENSHITSPSWELKNPSS